MRACGNFLDYHWESSLTVPLLAAHTAPSLLTFSPHRHLHYFLLLLQLQRGAERWPQRKALRGHDHGDLCGHAGGRWHRHRGHGSSFNHSAATPSPPPNPTLRRRSLLAFVFVQRKKIWPNLWWDLPDLGAQACWLQGHRVQYGAEATAASSHTWGISPVLQRGKSHLSGSFLKKQLSPFPRKVRESCAEAHTVLGLSSPTPAPAIVLLLFLFLFPFGVQHKRCSWCFTGRIKTGGCICC